MEGIIIKTNPLGKEQLDIIEKLNNGNNNIGNCCGYSYLLFQKLYKVGAVRVRGRINNTSFFVEKKYYNRNIEKKDATHYWVEANGTVFNENEFGKLIMSKDKFYTMYDISNVEYADEGFFYKNNYELGCGRDNLDNLNKYSLPNNKVVLI